MARKKERFDMELISLRLFEGDFKEMQVLYPKIKAGRIIRELIHRHIAVAKEIAQKKLQSLPEIQIELSDMEPDSDDNSSSAEPVQSSRSLPEGPGEPHQD